MFDFLELTQGLIDKNDFEETELQPLPVGEYRVKVANVEKKTSQSGNDYISMVMEIIDGDFTGRNIYNNFFLSVKTAETSIKRIYKMAEFAGITPTTFTDTDSIVTFCNQMLDKCFEVTYDEEAFNRVKVNRGL
jgi:hypothetical protein